MVEMEARRHGPALVNVDLPRNLSFDSQPTCVEVRTGRMFHNESAPIQLAQCRFPGLAVSDAKIQHIFQINIRRSNFIEQHSENVIV